MTRIDKEIQEGLYDPGSKTQRKGSWMTFVKQHKDMRTAKGLLDLKAISALWKQQKAKGYDLVSQKKKLNRLRAMRSKYLEHATKEQYRDAIREQKRIAKSAKVKRYDPASRNASRNALHGSSRPPKNWFYAMLRGIQKGSDVRDPGAIVGSIWKRLSSSKKAEIKRRELKGERFKYDLPLPEDMATRGTGTLRMVKPFKLAEVQVNLSIRDYLHALKSGLFSRMKRGDGTTALVKRCKSNKGNVNVFIDKAGK